MEDLDKYIDELFRRKLSGAISPGSPPSGAEWDQIGRIIQRKNFLRFNPVHFNIYYLAASAGIIAVGGAIVISSLTGNHKNNIRSSNEVAPVIDSISSPDTISQKRDTTFVVKPAMLHHDCKPAINENSPKIDSNFESIDSLRNESNVKEDIQGISEPKKDSICNDTLTVHEPEIKKTTVESLPSDTIIQIDTVRVQKKGILFKRKKP
jgi:hypothetical protein